MLDNVHVSMLLRARGADTERAAAKSLACFTLGAARSSTRRAIVEGAAVPVLRARLTVLWWSLSCLATPSVESRATAERSSACSSWGRGRTAGMRKACATVLHNASVARYAASLNHDMSATSIEVASAVALLVHHARGLSVVVLAGRAVPAVPVSCPLVYASVSRRRSTQ